MAKTINLIFGGENLSFSYKPIDRKVLYGRRRRVPFDETGHECTKASLLADGSLLIRSGMTAQGYFTAEGRWVPQSELEAITSDGAIPVEHPSTIGVAVEAQEISANDALKMRFTGTYLLEPESLPDSVKTQLASGLMITFPFNPRSDYGISQGVLVGNENGFFALIAEPNTYEYISLANVVSITDEIDSEESDDLDFEMF